MISGRGNICFDRTLGSIGSFYWPYARLVLHQGWRGCLQREGLVSGHFESVIDSAVPQVGFSRKMKLRESA
jgi:hypothetical protein